MSFQNWCEEAAGAVASASRSRPGQPWLGGSLRAPSAWRRRTQAALLGGPSPSAEHLPSLIPYSKSPLSLLWYSSSLFLPPTHCVVISHHVPALRFHMDSFLRSRVLIPSSFASKCQEQLCSGRRILFGLKERARSGFSALAFFGFTGGFILGTAESLLPASPPSNVFLSVTLLSLFAAG